VPEPSSWENLYATSEVETLPWYTPELDPDFEAALSRRRLGGKRILDLGTGPATHAIALASRGYDIVATDISPSAIKRAKRAAKSSGVRIDFRVDDVLESTLETGSIDAIVDRGVFHTLAPADRSVYVRTVHRILRPRGWLFLKCFSDKQPGTWGPHRISRKELHASFDAAFEILSIVNTVFGGTLDENPKALFVTMRRRGSTAAPRD